MNAGKLNGAARLFHFPHCTDIGHAEIKYSHKWLIVLQYYIVFYTVVEQQKFIKRLHNLFIGKKRNYTMKCNAGY